jgi:hypothetical protein
MSDFGVIKTFRTDITNILWFIIFPLFSAAKDSSFILLELVILIFGFLFFGRERFFFLILALIFSNYYAPMDNELRLSSNYPSFHTLSLNGIKPIDILVVLTTIKVFWIERESFSLNILKSMALIAFLGYSLILGALYYVFSGVSIDFSIALYLIRQLLIFLSIFFLARKLNFATIKFAINFSLIALILLSSVSFLFPNQNSLVREIYGVYFNVAIAGDEYIGIGLLSILLLQMGDSKKKILLLASIGLFFAVLAARKSGIVFYFIIYFVIFFNGSKRPGFKRYVPFLEHFYVVPLIVLTFFSSNFPLLNILFSESFGLLEATYSSVKTLMSDYDLWFFGIGPLSKYEITGLLDLYDHTFSFGAEAGNAYRYKMWFLPFDRYFLNYGAIGIIILLYALYKYRNYSLAVNYLMFYMLILIGQSTISITLATVLALVATYLQGLRSIRA